jgi:hypothetical protein
MATNRRSQTHSGPHEKDRKKQETLHSMETKITYHQQLQTIQSLQPLPISPQGLTFINQLMGSPLPKKTGSARRARRTTSGDPTIFSLHFPLPISSMGAESPPLTEIVRFRLFRDDERLFSTDGNALVFVVGETTHSYGVIYPDHPIFYPRLSLRATSNRSYSDLLSSHVVEIFEALGHDPCEYFSKTGRQCGICQFCGRDLSDEESKKRGYGAICGSNYLKN